MARRPYTPLAPRAVLQWWIVFILAVVILLHAPWSCMGGGDSWSQNGPLLDPCAKPTTVNREDSFTLGILFIPGQDARNITTYVRAISTLTPFLAVCDPTAMEFLNTLGARFAVYSLRVDRLSLLQIPYSNIVIPMTQLPVEKPPTMVAMAFRYNLYSDAVYLASAQESLTRGTGFIQTLSLMLNFETGNLRYIQWWNADCGACGGASSANCITQPTSNVISCATSLENCTCAGIKIPAFMCNYDTNQFTQCNTGMQTAFLGTDGKSAAFTTGQQVQRLSSLSIVSLYYTIKDFISSGIASVNETWKQIRAESTDQSINQGGSFAGRRKRGRSLLSAALSIFGIRGNDSSGGRKGGALDVDGEPAEL